MTKPRPAKPSARARKRGDGPTRPRGKRGDGGRGRGGTGGGAGRGAAAGGVTGEGYDLFDRRAYEVEDPWAALYIPPPEKDDSVPTGVRLSGAERRKIDTILASQRTPWNTTSDALRWLVLAGFQRLAEVLGDTAWLNHLNLVRVEAAMRAVEAKRVYLSEFIAKCRGQIKHLLGQGELEEAQRIYERVIKLYEEAPRADNMMRRLLGEMLAEEELVILRKATGWTVENRPS